MIFESEIERLSFFMRTWPPDRFTGGYGNWTRGHFERPEQK